MQTNHKRLDMPSQKHAKLSFGQITTLRSFHAAIIMYGVGADTTPSSSSFSRALAGRRSHPKRIMLNQPHRKIKQPRRNQKTQSSRYQRYGKRSMNVVKNVKTPAARMINAPIRTPDTPHWQWQFSPAKPQQFPQQLGLKTGGSDDAIAFAYHLRCAGLRKVPAG